MSKKQPLIPAFDEKVDLRDYDPDYTGKFSSEDEAEHDRKRDLEKLHKLQETFYAEQKHSLLIIFQATDTGGKDGAIEHVFRGVNPAGVVVTSFKKPSEEELAHDYLWRVHPHTPRRGMISVFNRSHYEDVLVVRVHDLVPKKVWKKRFDQINDFERMLYENGTTILKFYLHISKGEQKRRLESRRDDPEKQWKFNVGDLEERKYWDQYQEAYEDVLTKCNFEHAPWHIVPANNKWYRDYVIAKTIGDTIDAMDCKYPKPTEDIASIVIPD
ncbi:MAG: polyphosphate kinase 2 family protein [Anaerolineae bacterium]|nr:polyphosphate kinase 2 family protein [Anaerolineae bacterium]